MMTTTKSNIRFFPFALLTIGAIMLGGAPARTIGQEEVIAYVRLKFAPPDGTTCRRVMTFKTVRLQANGTDVLPG